MCRMDKTTHTRHTKDRSTSRVFSSCWTAQPVLVNQLFSFKNTTQTWGGVCNCKEVCQNSMYRRAGAAVCAVTQRSPFLSFPYVCPEPVLVTCSFLYINGSKRPFLLAQPLKVKVSAGPAAGGVIARYTLMWRHDVIEVASRIVICRPTPLRSVQCKDGRAGRRQACPRRDTTTR